MPQPPEDDPADSPDAVQHHAASALLKNCTNDQMKTTFAAILAATLLAVSGGCSQQPQGQPASTAESLAAATTSPVTTEIAGLLLGRTNDIQLVVPKERSSRDWRPARSAATRIRDAKLVVLNGAGWEPWSDRIALAPTRTVDLSKAVSQFLIEIPDAVTHQHGPGGAHSHKGIVPNTWLSPQLLLLQLPTLESALITAHPDSRELIQREAGRLRTTLQTLADLAVSLKTKLSENPPKVVTDGPEFLYLLRDLGIDPVRIQWPVDSAVNNGVADQIRQTAPQNGHPPALFILNDRRSAESEKVVSDAGFRVLRLDDLEQTSETKNAVTRLADNLRAFQACLETAPFSTPQ